jgi:ATP-binding cassette subfamily C (CFTR/MRP) protein 1
MNRHGGIADRGTYEQLSKHHLIGEKKDPQATSSSREDNVQLGEEVSLGEYQNELLTRLDDMRRQKGDWKSYVFYIGSIGWPNFFLFLFGAIVYVVFIAFFQIWVTKWAADTTGRHGLGYWLGLYGTWAVLIVAALFGTPL